jgi:[ribosomal protein S5]-alanine N-acetyltransferase
MPGGNLFRVELRSPTRSIRDELIAAMRSSRELHRRWLTAPTTAETFDVLLHRVRDERFEPMLVCRRDDQGIVGFVNIGEIVRGALQSGFLGYGVVAAHAGRGYMNEGMQLALADQGRRRRERFF